MPRSLLLVFGAAFLYMLGLSVIFPVIPTFGRVLRLSDFDTGILVSSYTFAAFFMAPLWGRFSQRRGRKPAILLGLLGFSLSFLLFALSSRFGVLLATRLAGGMVAAAVLPALFAYVADAVPADQRTPAMGHMGASIGLGILGGVLLGGFLGDVDPRLPFVTTAGIGLLVAAAVGLWLPESLTPAVRSALAVHARQLSDRQLTHSRLARSFAPFLSYSFLVQTSRSALEITIGFLVIDRFAGGSGDTGMVLGLGLLAGVAVQGGIRGLARRFTDRQLLLAGTLLVSIALLGVGFVESWSALIGTSILLGGGAGLVEPAFRSELSRAAEALQGEAQGLQSSAQSLGRSVAFFVFPWLYHQWGSPEWTFGIAGAIAFAAFLLAFPGFPSIAVARPVPASQSPAGAEVAPALE